MTQKTNKQPPVFLSPKGRTEWLKCFKADTKFDIDGVFGGKLIIDNNDATDLMKELDVLFEKAIDAAVEETGKTRDKIRTTDPYEVNQETGDVSLKFKLKAKVTTKSGDVFSQKPIVVDAKRQPITKEIPLWNGSLVRVGYQVIPYYTSLAGAGLSLRMKSVQILEAIEGANEATTIFSEEEGYSFDPDAAVANMQDESEEVGEFADDIPF
jgi:hypothetical protein|tara:strand:- start:193 stop:825 length:633 start_codon:yes stop_codon:yes gene_type:complete